LATQAGLPVSTVPDRLRSWQHWLRQVCLAMNSCLRLSTGAFFSTSSPADSAGSVSVTLIFYEAPHRIAQTLKDMSDVLGARIAVVARELTKIHEETVRGTLSELAAHFSAANAARGEMVIIVDRNPVGDQGVIEAAPESLAALVAALEKQGLNSRAALKQAAKRLGMSRDELIEY